MRIPVSGPTILRTLIVAWAVAAAPGTLARPVTAPGESTVPAGEPRLILPGNHLVRAGEWIALRWAETDSISELEILLSTDGGRHYSACISPQLDPKRCDFVWRVPPLSRGPLWMRIRFNRRGREIEGAPASPLTVIAGTADDPVPLALPPIADPEGDRAPASPRTGGEASTGPSSSGLADVSEGRANSRRPTEQSARATCDETRPSPAASAVPPGFSVPRSIPLRA